MYTALLILFGLAGIGMVLAILRECKQQGTPRPPSPTADDYPHH